MKCKEHTARWFQIGSQNRERATQLKFDVTPQHICGTLQELTYIQTRSGGNVLASISHTMLRQVYSRDLQKVQRLDKLISIVLLRQKVQKTTDTLHSIAR